MNTCSSEEIVGRADPFWNELQLQAKLHVFLQQYQPAFAGMYGLRHISFLNIV